ncbi:MAG: NDP-sugar synthase [Chthoniobacterales bacterium]
MAVITQAFVLGAGLGNRLRPLTDELPKPLIPIFQKPLISFAFDHLIDAGCEKLIVNTHRRPERFAEIFPEPVYRGGRLSFLNEPKLLGTGGGIRNALPSLGAEPFVVYSGDILTDFGLPPLLDEHVRAGNDVTLALRETPFPPSVALRGGRVVDIGGKYGQPGDYDFGNVSIWSPEIAGRIPPDRAMSFIPILTDAIGEGARIGGVVLDDGHWFNIGSRKQYLEVHQTIAEEGWKPAYLGPNSGWPVRIAPDAIVDPSAVLSGFYSIGASCRVGAGAKIENTVLWPGAQIASACQLRNCIVRSHQTAKGTHSDIDI